MVNVGAHIGLRSLVDSRIEGTLEQRGVRGGEGTNVLALAFQQVINSGRQGGHGVEKSDAPRHQPLASCHGLAGVLTASMSFSMRGTETSRSFAATSGDPTTS